MVAPLLWEQVRVGSSPVTSTNLRKGRLGIQQSNSQGQIAKEMPKGLRTSYSEKNQKSGTTIVAELAYAGDNNPQR